MSDGKFKCGPCKKDYSDLDEYREHFAEIPHEHKGIAPCNQCGISTDYKFTGKLAKGKIPAICKVCKLAIKESEE